MTDTLFNIVSGEAEGCSLTPSSDAATVKGTQHEQRYREAVLTERNPAKPVRLSKSPFSFSFRLTIETTHRPAASRESSTHHSSSDTDARDIAGLDTDGGRAHSAMSSVFSALPQRSAFNGQRHHVQQLPDARGGALCGANPIAISGVLLRWRTCAVCSFSGWQY